MTDLTKWKIETVHIKGSSMIIRADYDPMLESVKIYFKSGGIYEYCGAPKSLLAELVEAESAGKYFHNNIQGKYEHLKKATKKNVKKESAQEDKEDGPGKD